MIIFKKELLIADAENISIKKINTKSCEKHSHDFFELVYTAEGNGTHYIDDIAYKTGHGDLIFISCGQTHSYCSEKEMKIVNIMLKPDFISSELVGAESIITLFKHNMFAEFEEAPPLLKQCVHFKGKELSDVDALIDMLIRECTSKEKGYNSILQGGVRILFTKLLRCIGEEDKNEYKSKELFDDILSYIEENYNKKISLSDLAAQSFYNPVYFGKMMKKYCGKSFSTYLKEKRISKAASLLKEKQKSVEEVMAETGYSDKKLFYSHFKEIYNTTPGKFAKL